MRTPDNRFEVIDVSRADAADGGRNGVPIEDVPHRHPHEVVEPDHAVGVGAETFSRLGSEDGGRLVLTVSAALKALGEGSERRHIEAVVRERTLEGAAAGRTR